MSGLDPLNAAHKLLPSVYEETCAELNEESPETIQAIVRGAVGYDVSELGRDELIALLVGHRLFVQSHAICHEWTRMESEHGEGARKTGRAGMRLEAAS